MCQAYKRETHVHERFTILTFLCFCFDTQFFLEVLGSHKGERLEWYIIIIIAAELAIGVYELIMKVH
jgi:uncharacterized Rmd1/YagE family protein